MKKNFYGLMDAQVIKFVGKVVQTNEIFLGDNDNTTIVQIKVKLFESIDGSEKILFKDSDEWTLIYNLKTSRYGDNGYFQRIISHIPEFNDSSNDIDLEILEEKEFIFVITPNYSYKNDQWYLNATAMIPLAGWLEADSNE